MALKVPLEPAHGIVVLIVLSSAEGSGEHAQICRLDRALAAGINGTQIASTRFGNVITLSFEGSGAR